MRVQSTIALLFFLLVVSGENTELRAQASFYQGKSVRVVVGSSTGGGYDLWARLMALYLAIGSSTKLIDRHREMR